MSKPACKLALYFLATNAFLLLVSSGGCAASRPGPTPTPTRTPRPVLQAVTAIPTAVLPELPSPAPNATATEAQVATATPSAPPSPTDLPSSPAAVVEEPPPVPSATMAPAITPASSPVILPPKPSPSATRLPLPPPAATQPPQRGGDWDLEGGFYAWQSPHEGFTAFVGASLSSRGMGEVRAQRERAAAAPGHRPDGRRQLRAGSVLWHPWRDMSPDQWVATQETVRATGRRLAIYLRAVHPLAADGGNKPGGNTMFDNVSLVDLGQ